MNLKDYQSLKRSRVFSTGTMSIDNTDVRLGEFTETYSRVIKNQGFASPPIKFDVDSPKLAIGSIHSSIIGR